MRFQVFNDRNIWWDWTKENKDISSCSGWRRTIVVKLIKNFLYKFAHHIFWIKSQTNVFIIYELLVTHISCRIPIAWWPKLEKNFMCYRYVFLDLYILRPVMQMVPAKTQRFLKFRKRPRYSAHIGWSSCEQLVVQSLWQLCWAVCLKTI